ncbi:alpha-amylase family glycosyl hydrolase [Trichocoleus sp. FACHB-262]|uniref:alpha-amylase family glycosyl hydrolase n=1 Tax=Trichocoleus sp. FACHB-262 TaxID=2692869 RepID=UPI00168954A5|nr:alpha-amylase family glycosyl hydrolase [Trichocoleus sp. FACHB-262]MBD2121021.1 alpha amylase C-terminal domain-containing protein [Trichocoleus sp. FACHB-262]
MYEKFGAAVANSKVSFTLFLPDNQKDLTQYIRGGEPHIQNIVVAGNFQHQIGGTDWDISSAPELVKEDHPNGFLYKVSINRDLQDGYYEYKFFVTFENGSTRWCHDPCTKYESNGNSGFVVGSSEQVKPIAGRLPQQDLIIYELMIDDFTANYRQRKVPIDAIEEKLDYLEDLGINAIEFMPWTAWLEQDFSWGYNPYAFFSVEDRYIRDNSSPTDRVDRLKRLISLLHEKGIHVILDGVFNHVVADDGGDGRFVEGFGYYWLYQNPKESPFVGSFEETPYDVYNELDYNNACVQQFIFDVCKYWIEEFKIDGIRFDYTLGFYRESSMIKEGFGKLIADINQFLSQTNEKNISLILEHLTENRYLSIDIVNRVNATGCWYDRFFYDVVEAAAQESTNPNLMRVLNTNKDFYPGKGPCIYLENHDHSTVTNRVGGRENWYKTQSAVLALLTSPGAILIHNGQEFGDDYFLPGGVGAGRVVPRPVRFQFKDDAIGSQLFSLYRNLIRLRKEHPGIRSSNFYPDTYESYQTSFNEEGYGVHTEKDVVIYHRWGLDLLGRIEKFIIVINFSSTNQYVDVPFSDNGTWNNLLDNTAIEVKDFWAKNLLISSHWGKIFYLKP